MLVVPTAVSAPLYPLSDMKECDTNSNFESLPLLDFQKKTYKVQWSDAAGKQCPGESFPRIVIKHSGVDEYVHIITANVDVPPQFVKDPSWNPLKISFPWTFLDIGENQRKLKNPFYSSGQSFHDNPKWEGEGLAWLGSVYGLKKTSDGGRVPVLALSWGFTIKNKKTTPLRPHSLSARDWLKDLGTLSLVLAGWQNQTIKLKAELPD